MGKLLFLLAANFLFTFCVTMNKMADNAFYHALIGQNETTVRSRIGAPTDIVNSPDGGIILMYKFYSKGMFTMPEKSESGRDISIFNKKTGEYQNAVIRSYDAKYTSYQTDVNSLNVSFDKQGICVQFEQDLPKEKLAYYYEHLKGYIPKN